MRDGIGRGKAGVNERSDGMSHDRTAGYSREMGEAGLAAAELFDTSRAVAHIKLSQLPLLSPPSRTPPLRKLPPAPTTLALTIADDVHDARNVPCCVEDDAVGGLAVPPRPSRLLKIPLQALGQGVVHLGSSTCTSEHKSYAKTRCRVEG